MNIRSHVARSCAAAAFAVLAGTTPLVIGGAPADAATWSGSCLAGEVDIVGPVGQLNVALDYTEDATYHHWQDIRYTLLKENSLTRMNGNNFDYHFLADGELKHEWASSDDRVLDQPYTKDLGWASLKSKTEHWELWGIFNTSSITLQSDPQCVVQSYF